MVTWCHCGENWQYYAYCPVKGSRHQSWLHWFYNWFTKGRKKLGAESLQHQRKSPPVNSKVNSQWEQGWVYCPNTRETVIFSTSRWGAFRSQREGDVLSILSLCFFTVRMCVFVCTNMTSLLTDWRLVLAIVVAQGGDDDWRWHHKAQFWAE